MRRFWLFPFLLALTLISLAGCTAEDEIKKSEITFEDRQPIRLRVAIFKHDKFWWFVRMSGPEALVKQHEAAYETFVRSVGFDDKKSPPITFTEPKEWRKDPPTPDRERVAGFRIDAKPKELEISIQRLPAEANSLLRNLHRWQKQVHMEESESLEDAERHGFTKRDKVGEHEVTWIALTGLGVHTVSKPPEPVAADHKKFMPAFGQKKQAGGAVPFTYTAPAGWKRQARNDGITLDAYEFADGDKVAQLTITRLGGAIGENISRWQGQVGLAKEPGDKAERTAARRNIAGINAYYVDIANPAGPPNANRILGVIIPLGKDHLFVKMTGPLDLVGQQKKAFETFVDSFKREAR